VRSSWGITTGTCAAAAAKAAAIVLGGGPAPSEVELRLPGDVPLGVPILFARRSGAGAATASVRKDAGQDADVTHGMEVRATVAWDAADGVTLAAGEGVGTVTKPGLQVPPGQPAINPVPREMIAAALREVTARGVRAEIAIPGGRQMAQKTFNPRLGITGGLSILGTTGFVRPRSTRALHEALRCALRVAAACGVKAPVLVPGNIGAKAARQHFVLREEQVIEAGNAWGFLLDEAVATPSPLPLGEGSSAFRGVLLVGHPGKLAKLAAGQWDTHSSRSAAATQYLGDLWAEVLGLPVSPSPPGTRARVPLPVGEGRIATVEGMLAALAAGQRDSLAAELARRVRQAVARRIHDRAGVAVLLVDMAGRRLGADGDFSPWQ
jgi:cobalt-precorrin-5B (C1)-methyltransferase